MKNRNGRFRGASRLLALALALVSATAGQKALAQSYSFENGVLTELGTPGGLYSDARAINPRGEIVGSARNKDGSWNAFLFDHK